MKLEGAAHPFAGSIAGKMRAAPPCPFFDGKVKIPRGLEPWIPTLSKNKGATVTLTSHSDKSPVTLWIETWRKRVGVEPTDDGVTRRPPVLKTGRFTGTRALPQPKSRWPLYCAISVPIGVSLDASTR
jgi:hypothetical protein